MSKRKERFCDMTVEGSLRESSVHPLAVDGRCVEPAVGKCSQCQRDYCHFHQGNGQIGLSFGYHNRTWKIPLCLDCAEKLYHQFEKKNILPRRLETSLRRISRETAQWLGKKGDYAPAPIEQLGPAEVKQ